MASWGAERRAGCEQGGRQLSADGGLLGCEQGGARLRRQPCARPQPQPYAGDDVDDREEEHTPVECHVRAVPAAEPQGWGDR